MNNCDHTHVLHPTRLEIAPDIRRYVIQRLNHTLACTVNLRSYVKQAYWNVIVSMTMTRPPCKAT
jgi:hypothetical protein